MTSQSEVIAFLENPNSYGLADDEVQRIDTHGAIVFLVGDTVFKIKRAVKYPYMDFSTLEKRHRACVREMEINQPHAPSIYLGLEPITRAEDGQLAFGGEGQPVEWGVRMRRFRQQDMLDQVAARGEIDRHMAAKLADVVAGFHKQAPRVHVPDIAGTLSDIAKGICKNLSAFPTAISSQDRAKFEAIASNRISACARLLAARGRTGFIRHCHGDMHLQNIVLIKGHPTLFDAIEFDDRLARIDVLYDLAFLLADLEFRGLRFEANLILNRYLYRQNQKLNLYAVGLLPVFLALRHAIRAMVTLHRSQQVEDGGQKTSTEIARTYFTCALQALDPPPPRLIAVGGLSGSGKTTLARDLAPLFGASPGALHLRSDIERKSYFKVEETTRLSRDHYNQEISDRIYEILYRKARIALNVGHAVVVDAVFSKPSERQKVEEIAKRLGVPFQGLWLAAPEPAMVARVEDRAGDASDATADIVRRQMASGVGTVNWCNIDSSKSIQETLQSARAATGL